VAQGVAPASRATASRLRAAPHETAGTFTEYPIPTQFATPIGIAAGSDGALWFTEFQGNKIGRITVPPRSTSTQISCSPETTVAGGQTTCTARVSDADAGTTTTPTGTVGFASSGDGSFSDGASCTLGESETGVASCQSTYTPSATPSTPVRSDSITATYGGDPPPTESSGSTAVKVLSITLLTQGAFVIGDQSATIDAQVTFWGAQWWKLNSLSGGSAPATFMGFASHTAKNPPQCGDHWTTEPGNGSNPPTTVPLFMAVIASRSITKVGSTISGDSPKVVVVKTNPGYAPDPRYPGTGTVVGIVCGD
jgi:hypothetical protein